MRRPRSLPSTSLRHMTIVSKSVTKNVTKLSRSYSDNSPTSTKQTYPFSSSKSNISKGPRPLRRTRKEGLIGFHRLSLGTGILICWRSLRIGVIISLKKRSILSKAKRLETNSMNFLKWTTKTPKKMILMMKMKYRSRFVTCQVLKFFRIRGNKMQILVTLS